MRVLVIGASGLVGSNVYSRLSAQGINVVGTSFSQIERPDESSLKLDITRTVNREFSPGKIDVLIHCAGHAHQNADDREPERFDTVNRLGTGNLINWCLSNAVSRFVYVSSISCYDWNSTNGEAVDEDHTLAPNTNYGRSKLAGETLVTSSNLDWRVVRLATVFGEGDQANFAKMASAIKQRCFFIPGEGSAQKSIAPLDLASDFIARYALAENPKYRLINLALPQAPSLSEICRAYHEVCGLPKCHRIPLSGAYILAQLGDALTGVCPFPFTTTLLEKLTRNTVVSTARMQACFPDRVYPTFQQSLYECRDHYRNL